MVKPYWKKIKSSGPPRPYGLFIVFVVFFPKHDNIIKGRLSINAGVILTNNLVELPRIGTNGNILDAWRIYLNILNFKIESHDV